MMRVSPGHGHSEVCTLRPDGTGLAWLGRIGHVSGLVTTDTMPGGNEQLTCTLQVPPIYRTGALDPGRLVRVIRGASVQWEGILDEPVPAADGIHLTARGAGTWGTLYQAVYSTWTAADVLGQAIGRGLAWVQGSVASGFLTEQHDSASLTVTAFLDLYTAPAGQVWRVRRTPAGNQVDTFALPSAPTRILVTTAPAVRTLAGYFNVIWLRYQSSAGSGNTPAAYAVTSATNAASIAKHGRQEAYWDISAGGVMSAATAQSYGQSALAKYTAASWGGPFKVGPGQYLTMGGAPADLGCEHAGEVVQLMMADGPYGGEVSPAPPVVFPVGKVEYSDADGTLIVTPYLSYTHDLSLIEQYWRPPKPPKPKPKPKAVHPKHPKHKHHPRPKHHPVHHPVHHHRRRHR